ncbi:MAG: type II toxin-antitoxin system RelB/DinJ family antitoxin [Clostridiales bacterium]|nr:type II toxin-antitoxin system RelB/DinJ family antitoxin [Clostridiales bacterium]
MANTTTVNVRMDKELKQNAEHILSQIGLSSTEAIKLFYKQVELNGGLPFEIKLPEKVYAENRLFADLSASERRADAEGWLSIDESKKKLGR